MSHETTRYRKFCRIVKKLPATGFVWEVVVKILQRNALFFLSNFYVRCKIFYNYAEKVHCLYVYCLYKLTRAVNYVQTKHFILDIFHENSLLKLKGVRFDYFSLWDLGQILYTDQVRPVEFVSFFKTCVPLGFEKLDLAQVCAHWIFLYQFIWRVRALVDNYSVKLYFFLHCFMTWM